MSRLRYWKGLTVFLVSLCLFTALLFLLIPKTRTSQGQSTRSKTATSQSVSKKTLHYLALGDSLTEGVGDSSKTGGFVPLLSHKIEDQGTYQVTATNYGVAGNTSQQILKRMTSNKKLKKALQSADLMTLTVGGNDLMAVIRKNFTDLTVSTFDKPSKSYQDRLRQIIELARLDNPDLPIYVLGIYNPFYLNFSQITEMQTIVDNWNKATEEVTKEYDKVYFVSIDKALYEGTDGQKGVTSSSSSSDKETELSSSVLYDEDRFHPNNTGYQIIANQVLEKWNETKNN